MVSDPRVMRIDVDAARRLFDQFAPMFDHLDKKGIDYCLVGGLGVLAQCVKNGAESVRATVDADIMLPGDYCNAEFAKDYLQVYASNPEISRAVHDALFGDGGYDELCDPERSFINVSFIGADKDLDGVDTPDFDVCRVLNGRDLGSLRIERLNVFGSGVNVACVDDLLGMKHDTIGLYGVGILETARPQDFVDVAQLERILNGGLQ